MTTASFAVLSADMKKRNKIDITPGNTVRVFLRIQEKGKTRLQAFEGLVIARKHGSEAGATFTVRKVASGVGMEKTFPLYSPVIDKIEIVKKSKVRRSKLYYIRDKAAKEIRRRMKQIIGGKKDDTIDDEEEVIEVLDSPDINPEEVIVAEEETPEILEETK